MINLLVKRGLRRYPGAVVAISVAMTLAGPSWARGAEDAPDAGVLQITRGEQETVGEFGRAGVLVTFSARIESTASVSARVLVDDVQLEATLNREKGEAFWTGHGRALFAEHRFALIALAGQLESALPARDQALRPHEDLLRRVVALWAEAPAGLPLDDHTVTAPPPNKQGSRLGAPGVPEGSGGSEAPMCYYADDNGIAYFSCTYRYDIACHDADAGGHCWGCESVPMGCGGNCLSECGPGCAGLNILTWDCADHDRCCQAHGGCLNPFDSNCGDEYGEAADDFLFGWPNCLWC